jgi:hypothetical protein
MSTQESHDFRVIWQEFSTLRRESPIEVGLTQKPGELILLLNTMQVYINNNGNGKTLLDATLRVLGGRKIEISGQGDHEKHFGIYEWSEVLCDKKKVVIKVSHKQLEISEANEPDLTYAMDVEEYNVRSSRRRRPGKNRRKQSNSPNPHP